MCPQNSIILYNLGFKEVPLKFSGALTFLEKHLTFSIELKRRLSFGQGSCISKASWDGTLFPYTQYWAYGMRQAKTNLPSCFFCLIKPEESQKLSSHCQLMPALQNEASNAACWERMKSASFPGTFYRKRNGSHFFFCIIHMERKQHHISEVFEISAHRTSAR